MKFSNITILQYGSSILNAIGFSTPGAQVDPVKRDIKPEFVTIIKPVEQSVFVDSISNVELITDSISLAFGKLFKTPYTSYGTEIHRISVKENGKSSKYIVIWEVFSKKTLETKVTDDIFEEIFEWSKKRIGSLPDNQIFAWCETYESNSGWIADVRFARNEFGKAQEKLILGIPCKSH